MTPDLSSFYQHPLAYSEYVWLAYGLSIGVLSILSVLVFLKHRRLKKNLAPFEES